MTHHAFFLTAIEMSAVTIGGVRGEVCQYGSVERGQGSVIFLVIIPFIVSLSVVLFVRE